ncbi:MAG: DHH family phosphoesterase [Candidatus Woesearchaeota archaeon]
MILEEDIKKIREHLDSSENPLFFFDDDPDGLCSYLLLKKYAKKGHGVVVKCSPVLDQAYIRRIKEYSPDKVFVLDKPVIEQEFIDKVNVPVVWIDHHSPVEIKGAKYFNPRIRDPKDDRPTSYWCYKVTGNDLWLAMCGIIGDWYLPEFTGEFAKKYPGLLGDVKDPGDALYNTELGKLIRILSFILKGKTSYVTKCIRVLEKIESPYEILNQETPKGKFIYKYYSKVAKNYESLLQDAIKKVGKKKVALFIYPSTKMSFTGDLANEMLHRFSERLVIMGREKEDKVIMSIRSKKIRIPALLKKALEGLDGYGGGHEYACGCSVASKDFDEFISRIKAAVKKQ